MNTPTVSRPRQAPADAQVDSGLRWTTVTVILVRLVTTSRGLLLARLVGPHTFGVVAGVVVVTALVGIVSELGLTSYLIYRGDRSRTEARAIAPYALASGLLGAGLVAASAGLVADFYQEPRDRLITVTMSASVLLSTLSALPLGVLRAELRFRKIGLVQGVAETGALLVMLPLALAGAGVWALVAGYLTTGGLTLAGSWLASELGRPHWEGSWRSVWRTAFRYGVQVAAGGAFWAVALQADNAVVGHLLGASALGLYAFAYTYGALPGVMLGNLVNQVAFPVFSLAVFDPTQLRKHFLRFVRLSAITVLPVTSLSVALSGVVVRLVLGPKWEAAVVPLQVFLVMGAWRGLFPSGEVLRSLGRVNVELIMGMLGAPAVVLSAVVGSARGISAVALLVTAVFLSSGLALALIAARSVGVTTTALVSSILPSLALSIVLGLAAHAVMTQTALHPALSAVLGTLCILALYGAALYVVPGGGEIRRIVFRRG